MFNTCWVVLTADALRSFRDFETFQKITSKGYLPSVINVYKLVIGNLRTLYVQCFVRVSVMMMNLRGCECRSYAITITILSP